MRFNNDTKYDDSAVRRENKDGLFYWTVFILLLVLLTIVCWGGSYLVFGHPEKPLSYKILKKLKKLEPLQRFELTIAPKGEFLDPKALLQRYQNMSPLALENTNATLLRHFIRNYKETSDLVPYVMGTYSILDSFELTANDFFSSGVAALAQATETPSVLIESVYTCEPRVIPTLHRNLLTGVSIRLERRFDLSALIHVRRLPDGRIVCTTIPILYGNYASSHGPGSFALKPPETLNMKAGFPLLSYTRIRAADNAYAQYLQKVGNATLANEKGRKTPVPDQKDVPIQDQLVRIEKPVLTSSEQVTVHNNPNPLTHTYFNKLTPSSPSKKFVKTPPVPPPSIQEVKIARALPAQATLTATPFPTQPQNTPAPDNNKIALPSGLSNVTLPSHPTPITELPPSLHIASTPHPSPTTSPPDVTPAFTNVASGNWQTYDAGQMPLGRLVEPSEVSQLSERGQFSERGVHDELIYLKGNFLVTAARANRAVLRSQQANSSSQASKIRIIVEFPSNSKTPDLGSTFHRGALRPFLITDIQNAPGGMINVFVREITRN